MTLTTGSPSIPLVTLCLSAELERRRIAGECRWMVFVDAQGRWRVSKISKADIVDIPYGLGLECNQT